MKSLWLAAACGFTTLASQSFAATSVIVTTDSPAPSATPAPETAPTAVTEPAPTSYLSPTPFSPPTVRHWYGDQILAADGAAIALLLGAAAAAGANNSGLGGTLLTVSALTYVLDGPIVHFAHNEIGRGFGSLGIRVGAPFVLGGVGAVVGLVAVGSSNSGDDGFGALFGAVVGGAIGFGLGIVGAIAIDDAALAYDRVPATASRSAGFVVVPTVAPIRNGAAFGLVGAF